MRLTLLIHILAGGLGLVSGAIAMAAAKGAKLHRQAGMLFTASMLVMALLGTGMAVVRQEEGSVLGGLLAAYLVITATTTVRSLGRATRWVELGALLWGATVGIGGVALALVMVAGGERGRDGIPVAMFFIQGTVALGASVGDLRVLRSGPLRGTPRLRRHLWRMCFALFLATASFFLGQAHTLPDALRIPALLAVAAFLPLLVLPYWLLRVRSKRFTSGPSGLRTGPARLDARLAAAGAVSRDGT